MLDADQLTDPSVARLAESCGLTPHDVGVASALLDHVTASYVAPEPDERSEWFGRGSADLRPQAEARLRAKYATVIR